MLLVRSTEYGVLRYPSIVPCMLSPPRSRLWSCSRGENSPSTPLNGREVLKCGTIQPTTPPCPPLAPPLPPPRSKLLPPLGTQSQNLLSTLHHTYELETITHRCGQTKLAPSAEQPVRDSVEISTLNFSDPTQPRTRPLDLPRCENPTQQDQARDPLRGNQRSAAKQSSPRSFTRFRRCVCSIEKAPKTTGMRKQTVTVSWTIGRRAHPRRGLPPLPNLITDQLLPLPRYQTLPYQRHQIRSLTPLPIYEAFMP